MIVYNIRYNRKYPIFEWSRICIIMIINDNFELKKGAYTI